MRSRRVIRPLRQISRQIYISTVYLDDEMMMFSRDCDQVFGALTEFCEVP
jgi:hypothetical protein